MKIIATTPDDKIVVVQDSPTSEPRIELKRVLPARVIAGAFKWNSDSRHRSTICLVEQTDNPAWDYVRPDCVAVLDDGREVRCETMKQIKQVIKTGQPVESARQRIRRERNEWFERRHKTTLEIDAGYAQA